MWLTYICFKRYGILAHLHMQQEFVRAFKNLQLGIMGHSCNLLGDHVNMGNWIRPKNSTSYNHRLRTHLLSRTQLSNFKFLGTLISYFVWLNIFYIVWKFILPMYLEVLQNNGLEVFFVVTYIMFRNQRVTYQRIELYLTSYESRYFYY